MTNLGSLRCLDWAVRLQALAQDGLLFSRNTFDIERYRAMREIAAEMLADLGDWPVERILGVLNEQTGYATPKVDVRGAVFRDGQILLVRERTDGCWTLPGGWADPGDTPSEAIEREIREESGYIARAHKLVAVYDRARQGHEPPHPFSIYKLFFQCELMGGEASASSETDGVGFFREDALPELSLGRVTPRQLARLFEHARHPDWPADFD